MAAPAATTRRAARSRWVGVLGRIGLAAQGVCFGIIGVLALGVAAGTGGATTGPQGALNALAAHGWTRVLVVCLCVGFGCYAVWRLAQAVFDRGDMGADFGGIFRRAIQLVQGIAYALLAFGAAKTVAGAHPHSGARRAAAGLLGWPGGPELVGVVATVLAVTAGVLVYWAFSGRFEESLRMGEMSHLVARVARLTGVVGLCSLAVVSGIVSWFLFKAAVEFDLRTPVGIGGALAQLGRASYGPVLLGATAAGLLVFCAFDLLQARYHAA